MKPKEMIFLMNCLCIVVSSVAGLALEQVYNTSHDVVRRVATDPADPCLPSNHRNITHIGHRNINMRGTCPYTDGRLEDTWYHAGSYPISSYRNIPEMCSCGYKFPIWMNGSMPSVGEGVVSRTTCMRFGPFTCDQTINIQIKNCGNDFVYHLSATPDDAGYCFDVTTDSIISSASSPSTVSNTITKSHTTATSTEDATTASSTATGIPNISASSVRSTSHTTARNTENFTAYNRTSQQISVSALATSVTPTWSTKHSTTTPYYTLHVSTSNVTPQTVTSRIEHATNASRTSPYTTNSASGISSTYQTTTTGTEVYEGQIRLSGEGSYYGRVEVFSQGQWGTICGDNFDHDDVKVICRMLGLDVGDNYGKAYYNAYFGSGSGPIIIDDLKCSGYETNLKQCSSNTWYNHNCDHGNDAGVNCYEHSEQMTTFPNVYTSNRLTSFPWWFSTTKSDWYDLTTPGIKLQDAIFVNCEGSGWNITIDMDRLREIYPNAKSSDIYLGENTCTGVPGLNTVTFKKGLEECLTSQTIRENMIVYSNQLIYAERDPKHQFIIRYYNWTVGVECDVQRNETSSGHIHHESNNMAHPTITGNSHFSVNMSFYSDPNFMYQLQGNPLHFTVGDMVYVKVYTTTSDWTIKMRVHTCYTKPEQYSPDHMKYYIIQNGCAVDRNTHIISESTHETRFVFQDFEYTSNHEGIHVFCDAVFCGSYDTSRQCQHTCNPVVRRRNIAIEITGKK